MSAKRLIDWGKWGALAAILAAIPYVSAFIGHGVDISRTPAREADLEQKVNVLTTNCDFHFQRIDNQLNMILNNQK